ncbi:MAG TPA: hypothetical protein VFF34_02660, partial [Candidatus Nitrosocosmicus sp.]|nr:hypothetical protein [Candidatus Nitrosocosmicus sp.]
MAEAHPIPPVPVAAPPVVPAGPPVMSVIDVGASGIRMLIAELLPSGEIRTLEELQRPLSLGRETFHTGTLSATS